MTPGDFAVRFDVVDRCRPLSSWSLSSVHTPLTSLDEQSSYAIASNVFAVRAPAVPDSDTLAHIVVQKDNSFAHQVNFYCAEVPEEDFDRMDKTGNTVELLHKCLAEQAVHNQWTFRRGTSWEGMFRHVLVSDFETFCSPGVHCHVMTHIGVRVVCGWCMCA